MKTHVLSSARTIVALAGASVMVGVLAVLPTSSAFAASSRSGATAPANTSTNTLRVSPVRTDISIEPGETKKVTTTVTNVTGQAIAIRPIENDFVAGDEKGTPAIILDENRYAPTHSLKRFMTPLNTVTIPANSNKNIEVTISVPQNAQAGGYFGALRFAPVNTDGSAQVNLSTSVASLILMTVPGPTEEKLELTNFDIKQNGDIGSNFRSSENMTVEARFENKGNVQQGPTGEVYVKKGDKVVYTHQFNNANPREVVLPDSARRWEIPLKNIGNFGKYTVAATFSYGSKNQTIEVTKTFWVIPTTYILIGVAIVVALVALIVFIVTFLRSYKKRILRSAGRGGGRRY